MSTLGERLKGARLLKGMKQSEVAKQLDCASTSLTNWEKGKVNPSMEVLSQLCEVYGISPLSLLEEKYEYRDLVAISEKPVSDRSYEEQVALNFSGPILSRLILDDANQKQMEKNRKTAEFIQKTNLLQRFGGQLTQDEIAAVMSEYEDNGDADADILFVYHALSASNKKVFLSMLEGLISDADNLQPFNDRMDKAQEYTINSLRTMRAE